MHTIRVVALVAALLLAGCAERAETETVQQAGSSTVLPIAQAWAEAFEAENRNARFVVGGGGSGAGFKQFCRGEIAIADASRPIKEGEVADCRANGVEPFEIEVAIDGIAVVVADSNTFVDNLTVAELHRIWTADPAKQADRWSDLRPEWPDEEIILYGPGTDSGTFDYFVEVIIHPEDGTDSRGRSDYTPSEDDNILVQGVRASPYALGYFGLAYAEENADTVRVVPIDAGGGPVTPTPETVESGEYSPLSRPLYMYTDGPPEGILLDYFEFGLSDDGQALVEEIGYIRLPAAERAAALAEMR